MKNEQPKSFLKRVLGTFSVVGYILLICTLGLLCYFLISSKINNRVPVLGGYSFLKVVTKSMEPELKAGQYILVKEVDTNNLKVGDVISYYYTLSDLQKKELGVNENKIVITHRVKEVWIDPSTNAVIGLKTKGDNNILEDSWSVKPEQVIGKYDLTHPVIVKILSFFSNPLGMIILVIFPLSLILVSDIVSLFKVINEKEDDDYYDDDEILDDDDDDEFGNFNYGNDEQFDEYTYQHKYIDYYNDDD
jgi:signal peptidase